MSNCVNEERFEKYITNQLVEQHNKIIFEMNERR